MRVVAAFDSFKGSLTSREADEVAAAGVRAAAAGVRAAARDAEVVVIGDLARSQGAPVIVLAGRVEHPLGEVGELVDAAFGIHPGPIALARRSIPWSSRSAEGHRG